MATPHARLTYQDYLRFPDDGRRRELIDGEVFVVPAPNTRHQTIVVRVLFALESHVREHGGGHVFVAPTDVVLSDTDVVQPDVLLVSDDRAHIVTEPNIRGAPSLVVEVLSDPATDRGRKRDLYERHRVREYWIVDPGAGRVEVFRLGERGYGRPEILGPGKTLGTPLLPGLGIDVTALLGRA